MQTDVLKGVEKLIFKLGHLRENETLCIISDTDTREIGNLFFEVAMERHPQSRHFCIPPLAVHGQDPPPEVAAFMLESSLILGLTRRSMALSRARHMASQKGARYLSLPEYSQDILRHPALHVDFEASAKGAKTLSDKLSKGKTLEIKTSAGTDLKINISGRDGNFHPGYVNDQINLGSPPDIECNIAPLENGSEGVLVVDGSIPFPGLGKLRSPITLRVEKGKITSFKGEKESVQLLEDLFNRYDEKSRVLAELGIGFNEEAKLCGNLLIDEGCLGTFHCGFGSNVPLGGSNDINFHLDFIYFADNLSIDGQNYKIGDLL